MIDIKSLTLGQNSCLRVKVNANPKRCFNSELAKWNDECFAVRGRQVVIMLIMIKMYETVASGALPLCKL